MSSWMKHFGSGRDKRRWSPPLAVCVGLMLSSLLAGATEADVSLVGDVTGDGRDDFVVWRVSDSTWSAVDAGGNQVLADVSWGRAGDVPLLGDVDADGKDDLLIWRPVDGNWFAKDSEGIVIFRFVQWGRPGDVPLVGDLDGDGRVELVIWRPAAGLWFAKKVDGEVFFRNLAWGRTGDEALLGDVDGDGRAELLIWRPRAATWSAMKPDGTVVFSDVVSGLGGETPFATDVDGDGDADLLTWRPEGGRWTVISVDGRTLHRDVSWGAIGNRPHVGDIDGDARADAVYFRLSDGSWHAKGFNGTVIASAVGSAEPGNEGDARVSADLSSLAAAQAIGQAVLQSGGDAPRITLAQIFLENEVGLDRPDQTSLFVKGQNLGLQSQTRALVLFAKPQQGKEQVMVVSRGIGDDQSAHVALDHGVQQLLRRLRTGQNRYASLEVAVYDLSRDVEISGRTTVQGPDADGDGYSAVIFGGDDCDDEDRRRYPGNVEIADSEHLDEDCDPQTFGERDADGDGFFDIRACNRADDGSLICGRDCDDNRPGVHPSAAEVCNHLDDNCDGYVDEALTLEVYADADGDLYGDPKRPVTICPAELGGGYSTNSRDCDDTDPRKNPTLGNCP